MSCAKVTAMVFPMVVNPKDINKYRRIKMSEDSPRDSDAESLSETTKSEVTVKYEMDSNLTHMKLNKGSQTDIMMEPPHYPPPPPPSQLPRGYPREKRKVRMEYPIEEDIEKNEAEETENNRISLCEHCSSELGSTSKLDTPIDSEPATGTESSTVARNERPQNPQPEDSCAMECLYYAVQCSDCILL